VEIKGKLSMPSMMEGAARSTSRCALGGILEMNECGSRVVSVQPSGQVVPSPAMVSTVPSSRQRSEALQTCGVDGDKAKARKGIESKETARAAPRDRPRCWDAAEAAGGGGTAVLLLYCRMAGICLWGSSLLDHGDDGKVGKARFGFVEPDYRRVVTRANLASAWMMAAGSGRVGRRWTRSCADKTVCAAVPEFDRLDKQRCSGVRTTEAEGM